MSAFYACDITEIIIFVNSWKFTDKKSPSVRNSNFSEESPQNMGPQIDSDFIFYWLIQTYFFAYFQFFIILLTFSEAYYFFTQPHKLYYYSYFKIFPRFWLVKTTRIYHNQFLLTKFEKNLCHIEPMTSEVQSAADYWTDDVKSAACCRLLNRGPKKPGDEIVLFLVSRKTKSKLAKLLRMGK